LFYFEDDFKDNVIVHFFALLSPWREAGGQKKDDIRIIKLGSGALVQNKALRCFINYPLSQKNIIEPVPVF